jgi:hypothetical protein
VGGYCDAMGPNFQYSVLGMGTSDFAPLQALELGSTDEIRQRNIPGTYNINKAGTATDRTLRTALL